MFSPTTVSTSNSLNSLTPLLLLGKIRVLLFSIEYTLCLLNTDDDGDIRDICYPHIHDMLVELHSELPELRVMAYKHVLAEDGFFHVNQLVDNDVESHT